MFLSLDSVQIKALNKVADGGGVDRIEMVKMKSTPLLLLFLESYLFDWMDHLVKTGQ